MTSISLKIESVKLRVLIVLIVLFVPLWSYSQGKESKSNNLYLIIVSDDYENIPSLKVFKEFREQSFNVQIVTGTSIGTSKDDFRNYIRGLMPGYVLLVGKYGDFPVHVIHYPFEVESYNGFVKNMKM